MRALILVVFLSLSTRSHADSKVETTKSLGNGYTLVAIKDQVSIKRGAQVAPLVRGSGFLSVKIDAKARSVTADVEDNTCIGSTTYKWTFDHLDARIENAASFAAVRKKDYKAAAGGFAKAVAKDPSWNIAAYNLASAHQLAGDQAAAVAALAPWLAKEPIATYLQVTSDPDLAPLLDRAELKALRAKTAGNVQVTADGITGGIAYDAARGLIAFTRRESSWGSSSYTTDIEIFDVATGAMRATSTLVKFDDTRPESVGFTSAGKAAATKRAATLQKLLADLGFAATPTEAGTGKDQDDDKVKLSFTKAKLGVVGKDDTARALRGNTVVGTAKIEGRLLTATLVEAAKTIVLTSHRSQAEGCDGGPEIGVYLMKIQ